MPSKRVLLSISALNSITLYLYFFSDTDHFRHKSPTNNHFHLDRNHSCSSPSQKKPWPVLPSYTPWSQKPNLTLGSCEGYFGNGFTRRIELLRPPTELRRNYCDGGSFAGGGWFRCFHSETLRSSICEGGQVRMRPDKITMSKGGEKLETVMGRGEDEEMPVFQGGAFDVGVTDKSKAGKKLVEDDEFINRYLPQGSKLIDSILLASEDDFQCTEWIEEPTLLVTRYEYANLFHTFTDWYSAYVTSRVTCLTIRPHVVFVDGHCETQLEEVWKALFASVRYAKHFKGPVCFRHAILSPLGYETALFKGLSENINCRGTTAHDLLQNPKDEEKTSWLDEFGEMIKAAFGFPPLNDSPRPEVSGIRHHSILFVRREDYLAHPRHSGKPESRLSNEQQVFDAIRNWAASLLSSSNSFKCKLSVVNGLFGHMSVKEQVEAIQDASVIVGAHGAGMTHAISAVPGTIILEIISSAHRRPHFALIAKWKGLEYQPIILDGSHADPRVVIDKLDSILKSSGLGC